MNPSETLSLERLDMKIDSILDTMNCRFDAADSKFDSLESRFGTLESKFDSMESRFDGLESRFDGLELRFDGLESRFDFSESRFETFEGKTDSKFDSVLEAMMTGFESVDARLDKHEEILDSNRELLSRLTLGQEIMQEDIRDTKKRVIHLEDSMEEVQYSLAVLTKAEEKDAEATINHELRLQHLEKVNKIKAIPPSHLTDIQA